MIYKQKYYTKAIPEKKYKVTYKGIIMKVFCIDATVKKYIMPIC